MELDHFVFMRVPAIGASNKMHHHLHSYFASWYFCFMLPTEGTFHVLVW